MSQVRGEGGKKGGRPAGGNMVRSVQDKREDAKANTGQEERERERERET